jgi:ribosome recycling factor
VIDDIYKDADQRMFKSLEVLKQELSKIRTGRAHTSLLDHVTVSFYGSNVPLNQAANVGIQDARTLTVTAFDKNTIQDIEKAIMNADLGLNPMTAGDVIRVPLPALTEDRRKDLIKVVRAEAEKGKVAIRNIRRDANHTCKELLKEKEISEDEDRGAEDRIQKLTDRCIQEVDKLLAEKEKEMMEI